MAEEKAKHAMKMMKTFGNLSIGESVVAKPWAEIKQAEEEHKDSWWTAFMFEDTPNPNDLHVTHKYLGKLESDQIKETLSIMDAYFKKKKFKPFQMVFDKEEWFGDEKDTRVLRPTDLPDKDKQEVFMLDLKSQLDEKIKKDDYPEYKPHVSTNDFDMVDRPITRFALMKGKNTYREYT